MDTEFIEKLDNCSEFSCVFELVKSAVKKVIGKRRVGLILGLTDLPNHIGAFHQLGSNFIIINKMLLKRVIKLGNKKLINAYIFHILLHEYLHSFGYVNEQETQILTHAISEEVLGADHLATQIARYGIAAFFSNIPKLDYYEAQTEAYRNDEIEIIKDFESDNLNYFG